MRSLRFKVVIATVMTLLIAHFGIMPHVLGGESAVSSCPDMACTSTLDACEYMPDMGCCLSGWPDQCVTYDCHDVIDPPC
jgi:hypothetical protein